MDAITVLSYAIKIGVSTVIIWLSIAAVDKGNYRNNLKNAFITAAVLSILGYTPFAWIFGLVVWVFILINWYSIGFFKSFLCVIVYAIISFFLNLFLIVALVGGAFTVSKMADTSMYAKKWTEMRQVFRASVLMKLPKFLRDMLGIKEESTAAPNGVAVKKVHLHLKNGRSLLVTILMEGEKGILVDIADGRSEVVIRKDTIDRIEEYQ
jgi:energy-coupling factor transporter transmembrane protein EcfT